MKTSITLQEPFSYSMIPMIVVGILVALYGIYLIISILQKQPKKKTATPVPKKTISPADIRTIKSNYLAELENIKQALWTQQISTRDAYQKMSLCIRHFVYEVTGIQVQNYTLEDIKGLHMPGLEELIAEYYAPEFAMTSMSDSSASIERTKRVIELWN